MSCARHVDRTHRPQRRPVVASVAILVAALGATVLLGAPGLGATPVVGASASADPEPDEPAGPTRVGTQAVDPDPDDDPSADPPTSRPTQPNHQTNQPTPADPGPAQATSQPTDPSDDPPSTTDPTVAPAFPPDDQTPAASDPDDEQTPDESPAAVPAAPFVPAEPDPATVEPTPTNPVPSPSPEPPRGLVGPDRVPAPGSQPKVDAQPAATPLPAPEQPGWSALGSSHDLGIRIFVGGLIALVIAISGLVTVAVRHRHG